MVLSILYTRETDCLGRDSNPGRLTMGEHSNKELSRQLNYSEHLHETSQSTWLHPVHNTCTAP